MSGIKILPDLLAAKIAAGEVVERGASVVKELMENSIDAGASAITVAVVEGGFRSIRVADDGCGLSRGDASAAFSRHATSKITSEADLCDIRSLGFRGEALYSIAAVSRLVMRTRRADDLAGTRVNIEGGVRLGVIDDGCQAGTSIEVTDLFFNTPARLKFMKSSESEFARIADVFKRLALIHPEIRFKLTHGSTKILDAPSGAARARLVDLFGLETIDKVIAIDEGNQFVSGFVGNPELDYSTARSLYTYCNGRSMRDKAVTRAILDGYGAFISAGRYPFAVIDIKIPYEDVDVNIHPTKAEVRFKDNRLVYEAVKDAVRTALSKGSPAPIVYDYKARAEAYRQPFAGEANPVWGEASKGAPDGLKPLLDFQSGAGDVINPQFLGLEVAGQLWGEFLIAQSQRNESGNEFFIIDQHGAAERIAFTALKARLKGLESPRSQTLLLPEAVETTPDEAISLYDSMASLEALGFEITPIGPSARYGGETFLIRAVPDLLTGRGVAGLIKELIEETTESGGSAKAVLAMDERLMRIACHAVIRGRRVLTKEEGEALLNDLARVDFAAHCPHGRPIVKRYTRSEIEAMFGR
ncbi:MAG: DNA mismatch repair endonuclease MutL [Deltaproteobacteria bacterium]|nr:DNA mismatch repair endonuclease MutL [Deltaproteobacteria bacterium]